MLLLLLFVLLTLMFLLTLGRIIFRSIDVIILLFLILIDNGLLIPFRMMLIRQRC